MALTLFRHQAKHNRIYAKFVELLGVCPDDVTDIKDIPFLPVEAFKNHQVITGKFNAECVFTSSGTTGSATSRHFVRDLKLYQSVFTQGFERVYGSLSDYCVLALLPSYLERSGSSLVAMAQGFMDMSKHPKSGFYLNELQELSIILNILTKTGQRVLLLGVTYALLDLAEAFPQPLSNAIIMETGGMKGRRKEMVREDVHKILQGGFQVDEIHSEYGMTELLSQAYSQGKGVFHCPPWMRVMVREHDDPLHYTLGKTGGINVIDLANMDSCAFIATSDLGRVYDDGSFEVLGRFDYSDVRGCNLLMG